MRNAFLSLMVIFAIAGSLVTGAGCCLTMSKFSKGIDYDKIAQIQIQLNRSKAQGADFSSNPEHVSMVKQFESAPSKTMVIATKAFSVLSLIISVLVCLVAFDKRKIVKIMSLSFCIAATVLLVKTPELKGFLTGSVILNMLIGIAAAIIVLAANNPLSEVKRYPQ